MNQQKTKGESMKNGKSPIKPVDIFLGAVIFIVGAAAILWIGNQILEIIKNLPPFVIYP
jgi:small-conductance mechanosensitive channel